MATGKKHSKPPATTEMGPYKVHKSDLFTVADDIKGGRADYRFVDERATDPAAPGETVFTPEGGRP